MPTQFGWRKAQVPLIEQPSVNQMRRAFDRRLQENSKLELEDVMITGTPHQGFVAAIIYHPAES